MFKFRSRLTIFIHDLVMVPCAWYGAYWLRFNLEPLPERYFAAATAFLPFVLAIQVCLFWQFGLYRGVWRFSSLPDLIRIAKAVASGMILITIVLFFYSRLAWVPRAVIPLYFIVLLLLLSVPRFMYRAWKEKLSGITDGDRALIVGAGAAGVMLAKDLLGNKNSGYLPVAFVDDAVNIRQRDIRGLRVEGAIDKLPKLIDKLGIEVVLIAIPSATDVQMRRIVEICEAARIPFKTLPSVRDLLSAQHLGQNLRDVSIEDILGRAPVHLNWQAIAENLAGKKILVTGGGGSIGSELCKQLARIKLDGLAVLDQSEFNLYKIDAQLAAQYPHTPRHVVLGDVADRATVRSVIEQFNPDVIFHAAAYKHVPLLESQIREGVHNNVIGTQILAEEAVAAGVGRFVLISTDKAVNPTNIMGATKRAAEILCQNMNDAAATRFITVRFGNVLDSAGSVVPLFREQIKAGGPVTVTHPDISRYFMTIPEACQLIMKAETVGRGGEVFVLDMGEPVKITYLAEQMIRLSGKRVGDEIAIEYVGLRPGEKLYEELFHEHEQLVPTDYEKLLLAKARLYDQANWQTQINALVRACREGKEANMLNALKCLVPEYQS
ncbi:MAG: polysaccharide biosynthesis protein [Gammaproteobacteria bacterium HGW-Gammaproteobacteria-3]|nr:MAG: polysaccharide biosynthesis protein [Gammaproteobacteria bacterium HGW-Gammaproteobacteria-3]